MTVERTRRLARFLDVAMPGTGSLLAGATRRGAVALTVWTAGLASLGLSVPVLFLHPLRAAALAATGWATLAALLLLAPPSRRPASLRNAMAGAAAAVALLGLAAGIGARHFTIARVPGLGMFPGLLPGETILVARPRAVGGDPERGELWVARTGGDALVVGRVAAFGGERVRLEGPTLSIDGAPVETEPLGEVEMRGAVPVPDLETASLEVFAEQMGTMRHLAFHRRGVDQAPTEVVVPEGAFFLLGDNRSTAEPFDSRRYGPVTRERLVGRALHVLWSPGDAGSPVRPGRIGAWWP
ncbi:MAG TPA: signal peptidase I [Myxococcota bacterium]|jgi:signal peptidase I|nr:signal peptidase I [Myxococcota bacterium]